MSKQLGPGVRVKVGWVPDNSVTDDEAKSAMLSCGVIDEFEGRLFHRLSGKYKNIWWLRVDGLIYRVWAIEDLITPIDNENETETEQESQDMKCEA